MPMQPLCKQVLGSFTNGRVEQFIPYKPLEPQEMAEPDRAAAIARRLAQLHACRVPGEPHGEIFPKMLSWWVWSASTVLSSINRLSRAAQAACKPAAQHAETLHKGFAAKALTRWS